MMVGADLPVASEALSVHHMAHQGIYVPHLPIPVPWLLMQVMRSTGLKT